MRVLLLGEMSSFYMTLKEGLINIGCEVTLAANGDKWKKIPGADVPLINYVDNGGNLKEKIDHYILSPRNDERFRNYDVVQMVGTGIYFWAAGYKPIANLHKYNGKVFVSVAGDDYYTYKAWSEGRFNYPNYVYENNARLARIHNNSISGIVSGFLSRKIIKCADGVIPTNNYDYEVPYRGLPNLRSTILLPLNIDSIQYEENVLRDDKIVFFHGLNRPEDKGTAYIKQAMENIQNRFPNDVECIIDGNMPYSKYIDLMKRVNVVVDQCRSYGYGMNALIAAAQGKIVMTGAEPEVVSNMVNHCPFINIRPSVEQIENELIGIIENKNSIAQIGNESRQFVEKNHNYIDIAEQYVEEWKK